MTDWQEDCLAWWGAVLTGPRAHWCCEWDYLPIDDTKPEAAHCHCFDGTAVARTAEELAAIEAAARACETEDKRPSPPL